MEIQVGRIPVRIHPFFWLVAFGIGWFHTTSVVGMLVWGVVILISVLVHEFGHALTALAFGQSPRIDLVGFGGLTQRNDGRLKLWKEFLIVLNGPVAGFTLCLFGLLIWTLLGGDTQAPTLYGYAIQVTIAVNLFWTIVNLLPVHPLDGGRLLTIIMEGAFGARGVKAALFISMLLGGVIAVGFFALSAILPGAIFLILTFESYRAWKSSLLMTSSDQNEELQTLLLEAQKEIQQNRDGEAYQKLLQVRDQAKEGVLFLGATELMGEILVKQGHHREAYDLLKTIQDQLDVRGQQMMLHLAFLLGEYQEAIQWGNRSYQVAPAHDIAVLNAMSHSMLGELKPALGWLQSAIRDGVPNIRQVITKKEFDPIRDTPEFKQFLEKLR